MRKTRSDAVLLNLPEEQQAKLADWLLSGVPYHEARVLAGKEFGVSLNSLDPFKEFWRQVCVPHLLERRRKLGMTQQELTEETEKRPLQFARATRESAEQWAFEVLQKIPPNPDEVRVALSLMLKFRDQDLQQEKLRDDREKFQFDAAKACLAKLPELKLVAGDKGLSQEQKVEQIRLRLFGVLPEETHK